jgi:hypothetical protein
MVDGNGRHILAISDFLEIYSTAQPAATIGG